jgi:hypothetical protein
MYVMSKILVGVLILAWFGCFAAAFYFHPPSEKSAFFMTIFVGTGMLVMVGGLISCVWEWMDRRKHRRTQKSNP